MECAGCGAAHKEQGVHARMPGLCLLTHMLGGAFGGVYVCVCVCVSVFGSACLTRAPPAEVGSCEH